CSLDRFSRVPPCGHLRKPNPPTQRITAQASPPWAARVTPGGLLCREQKPIDRIGQPLGDFPSRPACKPQLGFRHMAKLGLDFPVTRRFSLAVKANLALPGIGKAGVAPLPVVFALGAETRTERFD